MDELQYYYEVMQHYQELMEQSHKQELMQHYQELMEQSHKQETRETENESN